MRSISSYIQTIALCLAAVATTFCFGQNRFVQVPSYSAGGSLPTLLAQHDLNGDGKLDLIVLTVNTAAKTETVRLLLGTGTGGYEAPKTMATYPSSYGVPLAGDVNRDGHLDLIFSVSGMTRVYLGTGETFETTAKVSTGVSCASYPPVGCEMQLADLNKDGNPDLVEYGQNGVAAMLGEGNGSFKTPVYAPNSRGPFAIGDFNNDGIPDMADTGYNGSAYGLQIQFGNGNGTFRSPGSLVYTYVNGQGGSFGVPVAADLRGNGNTDVIIPLADNATCGIGGFVVLLGNGNGTFASNPVRYGAGGFTYGITVMDMSGDGKPDIVAANEEGSSYSVFLNQGGGKFGVPMSYMAPQGVAGNFVVGDLTGNGRPDLTVSTQSGVDVFLNEGVGKLKAPGALEQDAAPLQAWAVDVNGDGILDLEVNFVSSPSFGPISLDRGESKALQAVEQDDASRRSGAVDVKRDDMPDSAVRFSSAASCTYNYPNYPSLAVIESKNGVPFVNTVVPYTGALSSSLAGGGDFNGDGSPDLLTYNYVGGPAPYALQVLFNNKQGAFPIQGFYQGPEDSLGGVNVVGDFNRDGKADVADGGGNELGILIGDGTGNFSQGQSYTLNFDLSSAFVRDVNADGKVDLILLSQYDKVLQVLLGNGDGTFQFQTAKTYSLPDGPVSLAFADFNNDGKLDIVVGGGSEVQVLLNNGNGTFKAPVSYAAGGPVSAIAAIDLTGNRNADVLVADGTGNKIFLLTSNGTGKLAAPVSYYAGGSDPVSLTVADFNNDGASDVVVADATTQGFMVLYNTGGTKVTLTSSNKTPTAGQTVTFTATVAATVPGSGSPSGTVSFKNGSATVGTATLSGGKATFHTASLSKGTHSITADYNGSSTFNPHASAAVTETVK